MFAAPEPRITLRGPCLVVGGAGGGIGTAMALGAAAAGAAVAVITDLPAHADEVVAQVRAAGGSCEVAVADVTDDAALIGAIARLHAALGPIPHLVNVVGGNLADDYHPAADLEMTAFDRVVARNVRYVAVACREVARPLIADGSPGSMVNLSSVAARGTPLLGPYAAAKAGLEALTRTMAIEWGPDGIRVNVVSVGTVRTPRTGQRDMTEAAAAIPLRRRGDPVDVANAAMFLLSDLAGYVTGATLTVDGGVSLAAPGGAQLSDFVQRVDVRERFAD